MGVAHADRRSLWNRLNPIFYQAGQLTDAFSDQRQGWERREKQWEGSRGEETQKVEESDKSSHNFLMTIIKNQRLDATVVTAYGQTHQIQETTNL